MNDEPASNWSMAAPPPPPVRPRSRGRRRLARFLVGSLLIASVFFLGLALASWWWFEPLRVQEGTWLEIAFTPEYPEERPAGDGGLATLGGEQLSAQETQEALRRALTDERVEGILLRPDGFSGGWAQAEELIESLDRLRTAGKKVWAYVQAPRAAPYYLATAAESIAIAPEGTLHVTGLQARLMFLQGSLDKLGIEADFIAVGRYKSAPEQLTRREASAPNREQVTEFLDDVYDAWIEAMCARRGLTTDRMTRLVDRGLFDPQDALAEGLVDAVMDETEVRRRLAPPGRDLPVLDCRQYLAAAGSGSRHASVLALIYATGTITSGPSQEGGFGGGPTLGSDTLIERLQRAADDDDVQAVVLRVDSPGGSALASDLIYREVQRVQQRKPVVVSVGDMAASGGYYIVMSADKIVADPSSILGSIGVYVGKMDMRGFYEKLGLSFETMQRGENADLFSDLKPFSSAQRARIEAYLQEFYDRFVEKVADGRMLAFEDVNAVAQGRVWSGRRAAEVGLVDETGTLEDAIASAKDLVGLDVDAPIILRTYQPRPSLLQRALRQLLGELVMASGPRSFSGWWNVVQQQARLSVTLDGSPQYHAPWRLRIE